MYRCDGCKTVGSNWVQQGRKPACGGCYNEYIELLEPKDDSVACPKRNASAVIKVLDDTWE